MIGDTFSENKKSLRERMPGAYGNFAQVYDLFMDNVPYEEWCRYLTGILREYGIGDGLILDLGCGTGKMTRLLAAQGYDMIGADASDEMLNIALDEGAEGILYLQQDMRAFELYGTVRAVVSVCDCMNYILEEEELRQVFALVNNYLDPGGIFIFDMNTVHQYREELGNQTICENREQASFIWENEFDPGRMINTYALTLFIEETPGLYRKYEELHVQRAWEQEEVVRLLAGAGLEVLAVYGEGTKEPPAADCARMYFVAREKGKRKRLFGKKK